MGTPRDPARERPGVRGAESPSCPTQRRKSSQDSEPGQPQSRSCAGRWTLDAGMAVSLLHLSLGRVEEERPPGHGVGPPAQLGLESEQRSPSPHPEPGWTGPSLPQPAETMGADVLWGLGWRGRGLRRHLPSCRESWGAGGLSPPHPVGRGAGVVPGPHEARWGAWGGSPPLPLAGGLPSCRTPRVMCGLWRWGPGRGLMSVWERGALEGPCGLATAPCQGQKREQAGGWRGDRACRGRCARPGCGLELRVPALQLQGSFPAWLLCLHRFC